MEMVETYPKGSKWSCTKGTCKDCGKQDITVFIPQGEDGIEGYCSDHIDKHIA